MKEETQETRLRISDHKFRIQLVIDEYWIFLGKLFIEGKISKRRYQHLKTFPQRFTDYELKEREK